MKKEDKMAKLKKLSILMATLAAFVLCVGTAPPTSQTAILRGGILVSQVPTCTSPNLLYLLLDIPTPSPAYTMKGHMASGLIPLCIMDLGPVSEIILRVQGI